MKLENLDILDFLPNYTKDDLSVKGLAYALTNSLVTAVKFISLCQIYANIDTIDVSILDELAMQFSALEYSSDYDENIKRSIIKTCMDTHRKRGTVAGVEKIIAEIFGNGYVEEFFDYNGDPFYFKVYTSNMSVEDDMVDEFERVLESSQNARSWLDQVIVENTLESSIKTVGIISDAEFIYI